MKKFIKKVPKKSLPTIPLTRSQRFIKRQEMYEQMLKECTKEEYDEIKKDQLHLKKGYKNLQNNSQNHFINSILGPDCKELI